MIDRGGANHSIYYNASMRQKRHYWVVKSEPDCYSIDDLQRDNVEMWDGCRNYQVRNFMRDDMQVGDRSLFYHSNAGHETGVVGEMEIVSTAYPDPTQFDPKSDHPDPKSNPDDPRWVCVDVKFIQKFPRVVTLQELKLDPALDGMPVIKKGNRLSVMPVTKTHYTHIQKLARSSA